MQFFFFARPGVGKTGKAILDGTIRNVLVVATAGLPLAQQELLFLKWEVKGCLRQGQYVSFFQLFTIPAGPLIPSARVGIVALRPRVLDGP